ncbi:MAG: SDR family NAD(P)-dependent oxidoreductase [Candidatus Marinimicrobia bacterium]|nr:SDR family NAD(P)-dependent oxidoreductase [Candidatus Neomarinimicrobiota bacterium]
MRNSYNKPELKSLYYDKEVEKVPSLDGKTIAITGTTSGTGFVAAKTVAEKGARTLLLNRKTNRSNKSSDLLKEHYPKANFIDIECDLQSFKSVKKAAKTITDLCKDGLDVLCNNAGVMALKDQATIDGFDIQMQTNHLSHFLLTKELLPLLETAAEKRGEARIVNHTSITRYGVKNLESKYFEKRGGSLGGNGSNILNKILLGMILTNPRWYRYSQTKLANAAFTACLHEKLQAKNSKIKALIAHPGLAMTNLQDTTIKDGGMGAFMTGKMMGGGQTMEDGAIGIIKCIGDSEAMSGDFYGPGSGKMDMKGPVVKFGLEEFYDNRKTKDLLWNKSCDAIGEDFIL